MVQQNTTSFCFEGRSILSVKVPRPPLTALISLPATLLLNSPTQANVILDASENPYHTVAIIEIKLRWIAMAWL